MKKSDLEHGMRVKLLGYTELAVVRMGKNSQKDGLTYGNRDEVHIYLDRYREDLFLLSSLKEYTIEAVYAKPIPNLKPIWEAPHKIKVGDIVRVHEIKSLSPKYDGKMQRKFPVGSSHEVIEVDGTRGVKLLGSNGFYFHMNEVRYDY